MNALQSLLLYFFCLNSSASSETSQHGSCYPVTLILFQRDEIHEHHEIQVSCSHTRYWMHERPCPEHWQEKCRNQQYGNVRIIYKTLYIETRNAHQDEWSDQKHYKRKRDIYIEQSLRFHIMSYHKISYDYGYYHQ